MAWPDGATYAAFVRSLDGAHPDHAALLALAARGLRGASYLPLLPGQEVPSGSRRTTRHAAVAAPYAHVTAPLRRLCDRATIEVLLAVHAGQPVPDEVLAELPGLPKAMASAGSRESGAARAAVDLVETLLLRPHIGQTVEAAVVSSDDKRSTVVLGRLAIQVPVDAPGLPLGETVQLRVDDADPTTRQVRLTPV